MAARSLKQTIDELHDAATWAAALRYRTRFGRLPEGFSAHAGWVRSDLKAEAELFNQSQHPHPHPRARKN